MIEATLKTTRGNLLFKISAESVKELFGDIAHLQEVFDCDSTCGLCENAKITCRVRVTSKEEKYYELYCTQCGATLTFGQHRTGGTLFAKRDKGERGWYRYQAGAGE